MELARTRHRLDDELARRTARQAVYPHGTNLLGLGLREDRSRRQEQTTHQQRVEQPHAPLAPDRWSKNTHQVLGAGLLDPVSFFAGVEDVPLEAAVEAGGAESFLAASLYFSLR